MNHVFIYLFKDNVNSHKLYGESGIMKLYKYLRWLMMKIDSNITVQLTRVIASEVQKKDTPELYRRLYMAAITAINALGAAWELGCVVILCVVKPLEIGLAGSLDLTAMTLDNLLFKKRSTVDRFPLAKVVRDRTDLTGHVRELTRHLAGFGIGAFGTILSSRKIVVLLEPFDLSDNSANKKLDLLEREVSAKAKDLEDLWQNHLKMLPTSVKDRQHLIAEIGVLRTKYLSGKETGIDIDSILSDVVRSQEAAIDIAKYLADDLKEMKWLKDHPLSLDDALTLLETLPNLKLAKSSPSFIERVFLNKNSVKTTGSRIQKDRGRALKALEQLKDHLGKDVFNSYETTYLDFIKHAGYFFSGKGKKLTTVKAQYNDIVTDCEVNLITEKEAALKIIDAMIEFARGIKIVDNKTPDKT